MKILFDIGHPAHVHLFRNLAKQLKQNGHQIFFTARKKECNLHLLEYYGFEYKSFGTNYKTIPGKIWGLFKFSFLLLKYSLKVKPDIFISHSSVYPSIVSFLLHKPHICMEDTGNMEQVGLARLLGAYFLTSRSFRKKLGKRQFFYAGYHELAYLHPSYFKADESVLEELGVKKGEPFVVLRFVSWTSSHDIYQHGFTRGTKPLIVEKLKPYARIFISSEDGLSSSLEQYRIKVSPEKIHHVLAFATLFIGEGATMASECAMLATPAIYVNSSSVDYCTQLEEKYNLVFNFRDEKGVLDKAIELLKEEDLHWEFRRRNARMLADMIDVTAFFTWFVENFPRSAEEMKKNPYKDYDFILETNTHHHS